MTNLPEEDCLKILKETGLEWFKVHADQRLRMFNFFLLIAGFSIGGFFAALQIKSALAASTVAFVLGTICICFKFLDRRTSQLMKHGKKVLEESLERLFAGAEWDMPNVVKLSDNRDGIFSYRQVFNGIFWLFGMMSIVGIFFPWFFLKSS